MSHVSHTTDKMSSGDEGEDLLASSGEEVEPEEEASDLEFIDDAAADDDFNHAAHDAAAAAEEDASTLTQLPNGKFELSWPPDKPLPMSIMTEAGYDPMQRIFVKSDVDFLCSALGVVVRGHSAASAAEGAADDSAVREEAVEAVVDGKNVLVVGAGGTGKSHTIWRMYKELLDRDVTVCVAAMTGAAAVCLGGSASAPEGVHVKTLHSALKGSGADTLFVDECSMMSSNLFSKVRGCRLFQQIVFVGDFFQLAPVASEDDPGEYLFENAEFRTCFGYNVFELTTNHRMKPVGDAAHYLELIARVRTSGTLSEEDLDYLSRFSDTYREKTPDHLEAYPYNNQVNEVNNRKLEELFDDAVDLVAKKQYRRKTKDGKWNTLSPGDRPPEALIKVVEEQSKEIPPVFIKTGARVMLTTNLDLKSGLINGSTGWVQGEPSSAKVTVQFDNGERRRLVPRCCWKREMQDYRVEIKAIPLCVAYAMTLHKMQGRGVEKMYADLKGADQWPGMVYVALSRLVDPAGAIFENVDYLRDRQLSHVKVKQFQQRVVEEAFAQRQIGARVQHDLLFRKGIVLDESEYVTVEYVQSCRRKRRRLLAGTQ